GFLEAVLGQLLTRPPADVLVRHLLQVALYQLLHSKAQPYTIVDHAVPACAQLGFPLAQGLVNAVLRNFLRRRAELETAAAGTDAGRYSYAPWWITKLATQFPQHYRDILEAGNARPPLTLRVNRRRIMRDDYIGMLASAGIGARSVGRHGLIVDKPRPIAQLPGFADGLA